MRAKNRPPIRGGKEEARERPLQEKRFDSPLAPPHGGRMETAVIKDIVTDDALLSPPCERATAEDAPIAQDLVDTLLSRDDAACLAANQIGAAKCLFAYLDENDQPHVVYNPTLKKALRPSKAVDACLSREGEAKVTRFDWITVTFEELEDGALVPRKQVFEGWTAQLVQHMIDHCKGKLV